MYFLILDNFVYRIQVFALKCNLIISSTVTANAGSHLNTHTNTGGGRMLHVSATCNTCRPRRPAGSPNN